MGGGGHTLRLGQRVEGGRLDGHVQWFGLQPGVSEEPLKVFEQGRNTVTSVHLQDGCGHSVEDGWEKLERRPETSWRHCKVVPTRDAEWPVGQVRIHSFSTLSTEAGSFETRLEEVMAERSV